MSLYLRGSASIGQVVDEQGRVKGNVTAAGGLVAAGLIVAALLRSRSSPAILYPVAGVPQAGPAPKGFGRRIGFARQLSLWGRAPHS